eukprot:scaffold3607_cov114-Isochrysis_galbana.AAC.3
MRRSSCRDRVQASTTHHNPLNVPRKRIHDRSGASDSSAARTTPDPCCPWVAVLAHPELQSGGCGDATEGAVVQLPLDPPAVGRAETPAICGDLPCQILDKEGRGPHRRSFA